ncbi:hypothetical protein [Arthrobacter sp. JCM 19049]|uniref:hypothetical protein n=1 Tax=Arthrobacter sp. JCM 19049 TaxID=1460643 RepID=UPI000A9F49FD|nr:hypothetical protein [Arthrobacter sp. JCM 19049]
MSPTHRSGTEQRMVGAIWAQTTDGVIGDAGTMPGRFPRTWPTSSASPKDTR